MWARFGKAIGGHTRNINVHYYPKKVVYDIPMYNEQRDLGKLVGVQIYQDNSRMVLEFDICRDKFKKDVEYLAIEKCPLPVSTTQSGELSGSDVTSNTSRA
jgi:hypothetical protein